MNAGIAQTKSTWLEKVINLALVAYALTLAFPNQYNVIFFVLLVLLAIVKKGPLFFVPVLRQDLLAKLLAVYLLVYMATSLRDQSVSLFFSTMERRAPLFLIPVALAVLITSDHQKKLCMRWFVISVFACSVLSFVNLFYSFTFNSFNLQYFSWQLNEHTLIPSNYLSLFITLSIIIVWDRFATEEIMPRQFSVPILVFLFAMQLLLGSRMPFLATIFLLAARFSYLGIVRRGRINWIPVVLLVALAVAAIAFVPYLRHKFSALTEQREPRYFEWRAAVESFKESPIIGHGLTGADESLYDLYDQMGFPQGRTNEFNSHNEILQAAITLGIPGVILIVWIMITLFQKGWSTGKYLPVAFVSLYLICSLTEVILMRSKGIAFVSFFIGLFLFCDDKRVPQNREIIN